MIKPEHCIAICEAVRDAAFAERDQVDRRTLRVLYELHTQRAEAANECAERIRAAHIRGTIKLRDLAV